MVGRCISSSSRLRLNLEKLETKSEGDKKHFLELFVDRIDVRFDDKNKEHELTIRFRLPLIEEPNEGDAASEASPYMRSVIIPPLETTPQ